MAFCMSLAWKTSKHYTIGRCTLLILSTCTPYISMFLNKILIDSLTIINEKKLFFYFIYSDPCDVNGYNYKVILEIKCILSEYPFGFARTWNWKNGHEKDYEN